MNLRSLEKWKNKCHTASSGKVVFDGILNIKTDKRIQAAYIQQGMYCMILLKRYLIFDHLYELMSVLWHQINVLYLIRG